MSTIGTTLFSKIEINGQEVDIATLDANDGIYALPAGYTTANVKFTMIDNTSIPRGVFEENSYITAMTLPDAMTYIASYSFHGVNNINISDKNAILAINPYAFDAEPTPSYIDPDLHYVGGTGNYDLYTHMETIPGLQNSYNVSPITYTSSDTAVATVNPDGIINYLAVGTTTITASFAGDTTYEADTTSFVLTISDSTPQKTDLPISSFSCTMNEGDTTIYINSNNYSPVPSYSEEYLDTNNWLLSCPAAGFTITDIQNDMSQAQPCLKITANIIAGTLSSQDSVSVSFNSSSHYNSLTRSLTPYVFSKVSLLFPSNITATQYSNENSHSVSFTFNNASTIEGDADYELGQTSNWEVKNYDNTITYTINSVVKNGNSMIISVYNPMPVSGLQVMNLNYNGSMSVNSGSTQYNLTVSSPPLSNPYLSFTNATETIDLGDAYQTQTLNNPYSVSPITWSSSDSAVATIDSSLGTITVVGAGTTTITASFAGDSSYYSDSASYTLTVN